MTFVSGVISRLKQRNSIAVDFYRITSRSINLETGLEETTKTKLSIQRVIVLPPQVTFQNSQAVPAISTGLNFGGFISVEGTTLGIDGRDVPSTFVFDIENCYAVIKNKKYELTRVQDYMLGEAFIITVKAVTGNLEQIIDRNFSDRLTASETYGRELE